MCLQASLASVNLPVDSMTICAPTEVQSSCAGSLLANTLIRLPSTFNPDRNVLASFLGIGELACRFDDDLRAHRSPVELRRIFTRKYLDTLAIHIQSRSECACKLPWHR